jgi:hypothetical protein
VRKYVGLFAVLMLACVVLSAFPVHAGVPYCWFNKEIWACCEWKKPPYTVSTTVGADPHWQMRITIALPSYWGGPITDVTVKDRFGAEIEIDSLGAPTHGDAWWDHGPGKGKKKSGKVFLTWEIDELSPGETAVLEFTISPGLNGAGKQCYTSCGCYELNSGAVLKFMYGGKQYSVYSGPFYVSVSA